MGHFWGHFKSKPFLNWRPKIQCNYTQCNPLTCIVHIMCWIELGVFFFKRNCQKVLQTGDNCSFTCTALNMVVFNTFILKSLISSVLFIHGNKIIHIIILSVHKTEYHSPNLGAYSSKNKYNNSLIEYVINAIFHCFMKNFFCMCFQMSSNYLVHVSPSLRSYFSM